VARKVTHCFRSARRSSNSRSLVYESQTRREAGAFDSRLAAPIATRVGLITFDFSLLARIAASAQSSHSVMGSTKNLILAVRTVSRKNFKLGMFNVRKASRKTPHLWMKIPNGGVYDPPRLINRWLFVFFRLEISLALAHITPNQV
jgi:hypothetical protein